METLRDECVFRPLNEDFVFVMMGGRLKGLSGPNTFTCRNLHCQCVCVCVCVCEGVYNLTLFLDNVMAVMGDLCCGLKRRKKGNIFRSNPITRDYLRSRAELRTSLWTSPVARPRPRGVPMQRGL